MDFSKYLFRCHMVGHIIDVPIPLTKNQESMFIDYKERASGNGRPLTDNQQKELTSLQHKFNESQKYTLKDSTKKLLSTLAYAEKTRRFTEINSPKITKGLEVEKEARDILTRVSGIFFTVNSERRQNEWVTGITDVEPKWVVIDIKSAWSWESFSKILQESTNQIYLRQGDSYMDLWNLEDFLLCHILLDTPSKLVDGEIRKHDYQNNILDFEGNVKDESIDEVKGIVTNHIFSRKGLEDYCNESSNVHIEWFNDFVEIPESERVHMIPHKLDKVRIEQRNECIILAREYMGTCKPINNFDPNLLSI